MLLNFIPGYRKLPWQITTFWWDFVFQKCGCAFEISSWIFKLATTCFKGATAYYLVIQKIFQMILQMIFQPCGRGFKRTVARLKYAIEPVKQVAAFLNCKHVTTCFKHAVARLKYAAGCSNTRLSGWNISWTLCGHIFLNISDEIQNQPLSKSIPQNKIWYKFVRNFTLLSKSIITTTFKTF